MTEYETQNKDYQLIHKPNHTWDINYLAGDIVETNGLDSLKNAIIFKIMTGYQELYRTGNPTYKDYGNKAWSQIKANRTENTRYKIEQYILEALKEIRRIRTVDELTVTEDTYNEGYIVEYTVTALNDEQVTDTILLSEATEGITTYIKLKIEYTATTEDTTPGYTLTMKLTDEFQNPVTGEILYIYINNTYYRITPSTNFKGETSIFYPKLLGNGDTVTVVFKGNSTYSTSRKTKTVV